ncbi:hypothetical protein [Niabella sp.]|uniref:hypothetical protein n=1 Tax=Niabella sp. TaxID=1962976 RepID=UPI00262B5C5F|nr:hypothetical protein [Niabella sp.]
MNRTTGWAFVIGLLTFVSCKLQARNAPEEEAPFTEKNWQLVSLTVHPAMDWDLDGEPETDIAGKLDLCERDDGLLFRSNRRVLRFYGAARCDDEAAQKETGNWAYEAAQKRLTVNEENAGPKVYEVAVSEAKKLVLLHRFSNGSRQHEMTAVYTIK